MPGGRGEINCIQSKLIQFDSINANICRYSTRDKDKNKMISIYIYIYICICIIVSNTL